MAEARQWLTRRRLLGAVLGLILVVVGWWSSAYPHGMLAAWIDHARGRYEIKTFGLPPPWEWEYRRLVQERYGVEVNAVAGCVVTQDLVWYVDGYNSVSETRIQTRFGKDIFTECAEEARTAHKKAHPRE